VSLTLALFCWLFALLAVGAACRALLRTVFGDDKWAYLFFPGIACRRVISVAAILLSGGTVTHASLSDPPLTGVEHQPSALPILPGIFCALAPLFGSMVLLGLWFELFGDPLGAVSVPGGLDTLRGFAGGLAVVVVDAGEAIGRLDFWDPLTWLLLWGGLNLSTLLGAEREDPFLAALGLGLLLLICGIYERMQGGIDGWLQSIQFGQTRIWSLLVIAVTLSLGVLALAGIAALLLKMSRAVRSG